MIMNIPALQKVLRPRCMAPSALDRLPYLAFNIRKVKDASGHEHASNGQFGSGGSGADDLSNFSLGPSSKPKDRPNGHMRLVDVKLDSLGGNTSQAISHHLEKLVGSSPDLQKVSLKIKSSNLREKLSAKESKTAYAIHDQGTVTLNDRYFGNDAEFRKDLKVQEKSGFHPKGCDTPESIITHELGHVLFEGLEDKGDERADAVNKLITEAAKSGELAKISRYAQKAIEGGDHKEAQAEIFASIHHTPESEQHPLVKEVAKILGATQKAAARDYKEEYREYHGSPKHIKERAQRNAARAKLGLKPHDGKEVDHKNPISAGGSNSTRNLRAVSRETNRKKGAKKE